MAKIITMSPGPDKDKVQDLMLQVELLAKRAEPHFRAIKEIEAEIEAVKVKIKHVSEEAHPECKTTQCVNLHYREDSQDVQLELLDKKDMIKQKLPTDMPDELKNILSTMIDGLENL